MRVAGNIHRKRREAGTAEPDKSPLHTIARDSRSMMPKDLHKIPMGSPQQGTK